MQNQCFDTRRLTIDVRVGPKLISATDAAHVLLAVGLAAVGREVYLPGALGDEGVTEIGFESHSVPGTQLGPHLLEQMRAKAVALGAHQLRLHHVRTCTNAGRREGKVAVMVH